MYYVLLNDLEKPNFDVQLEGALLDSKGNLSPNIFGEGGSVADIADKNYFIKINYSNSQPGKFRDRLSILVHNSDLFVVSEKVQKLLIDSGKIQFEFYPLKFDFNGRTFSQYKIVNVLNKIDCINYDESEIEFESYDDNDNGEGSIDSIDRLVLEEGKIPPDLDIFLLGRRNDSVIIIHERLATKIKEREISGFVFCNPEDFQL